MKFLIIFALSCGIALGQAVPPSYPYPVPFPASGSTPPFKVNVTQVVQPTDYSDPRPVLWDVWVGGGYRSVNTTIERDSILAQRRKEGMMVFVAANSHVYRLGSNLTTWIDLGDPATWTSATTTIYTGDGTLAGNRIVGGGGFSLDFSANSTVNFSPGTSFTASGANVFLNAVTATKINNTGPSPFLFLATPPAATTTHELLARDPATGNISFSPSYTINSVASPTTIYTANGTLAGNRTVSGGGVRSLSLTGMTTLGLGASTAIVAASGNNAISVTPTTVELATPKVFAGTATNGFVPILSNQSTGAFDWGLLTNLYNADGTLLSDRTVTGAGKNLTFEGIKDLQLNPTNNLYIGQVFNPTTNWPRTKNVYISGTAATAINWFETNYYVFPSQNVVGATNEDGIMVGGFGGHTVAQTRSIFPVGGSQDYVNITATTLTAGQHSNGKIYVCNNASPIALNVDGDLFPDGGRFEVIQKGAGVVTVTVSNALTALRNRQSFTSTSGQYATIWLRRAGSDLYLSGDGAP